MITKELQRMREFPVEPRHVIMKEEFTIQGVKFYQTIIKYLDAYKRGDVGCVSEMGYVDIAIHDENEPQKASLEEVKEWLRDQVLQYLQNKDESWTRQLFW